MKRRRFVFIIYYFSKVSLLDLSCSHVCFFGGNISSLKLIFISLTYRLGYTYLYVRMLRNPALYGVGAEEAVSPIQ